MISRFWRAIAGMFFADTGDRMDLRKFLTVGMLMSGLWVSMFGMGYYADVHSVWYYVGVQMVAGVMQSFVDGRAVVSAMGNWFAKVSEVSSWGIWNAHTSVGNMLGEYYSRLGASKRELGHEFHRTGRDYHALTGS